MGKGLERRARGTSEYRHRMSVWKNRPVEESGVLLMGSFPDDPFGGTSFPEAHDRGREAGTNSIESK